MGLIKVSIGTILSEGENSADSPFSVTSPPYVYDISAIESSVFSTTVRKGLFDDFSGSLSVVVPRELPQGDAGHYYVDSVDTLVHYYWQQLSDVPFVVVLSFADADLTSADYAASLPSNEVLSYEASAVTNSKIFSSGSTMKLLPPWKTTRCFHH